MIQAHHGVKVNATSVSVVVILWLVVTRGIQVWRIKVTAFVSWEVGSFVDVVVLFFSKYFIRK